VRTQVLIVGGGFTGLSAAYELSKDPSFDVTVLEADRSAGGLASSFTVNGVQLEKFYHHWFTSDLEIMQLIAELGVGERVIRAPTTTGTYYANKHYRLSTPGDLLRFGALSFVGRVRLGFQALWARGVRDWRKLEHLTAENWLRSTGGHEVYEKVWEPLLKGKFGPYAQDVGAVWFWNKLKLRGGSRGVRGREELAYFAGGFAALIEILVNELERRGVRIISETLADRLEVDNGRVVAVKAATREFRCDACLLTTALPIVAGLVRDTIGAEGAAKFEEIEYLANVCLVLHLNRSLSSTYWLNVNDASFPFVGVIEHTNFIDSSNYGGAHLIYLSKYLAATDPLFSMETEDLVVFTLPHLVRMFPEFSAAWIVNAYSWRARYAQPVVRPNYAQSLPPIRGPIPGCYVASMAQIYPEDRGTNYAVRIGRQAAEAIRDDLAAAVDPLARVAAREEIPTDKRGTRNDSA
jgi:protoporphyrinogen oxidase